MQMKTKRVALWSSEQEIFGVKIQFVLSAIASAAHISQYNGWLRLAEWIYEVSVWITEYVRVIYEPGESEEKSG